MLCKTRERIGIKLHREFELLHHLATMSVASRDAWTLAGKRSGAMITWDVRTVDVTIRRLRVNRRYSKPSGVYPDSPRCFWLLHKKYDWNIKRICAFFWLLSFSLIVVYFIIVVALCYWKIWDDTQKLVQLNLRRLAIDCRRLFRSFRYAGQSEITDMTNSINDFWRGFAWTHENFGARDRCLSSILVLYDGWGACDQSSRVDYYHQWHEQLKQIGRQTMMSLIPVF